MTFSNRSNKTCSPCCEPLACEPDCPPYYDYDKKIKKCIRCNNLVQDPSFESQSFQWVGSNISYTNFNVYEGLIQLQLGPGVASLFQELSLEGVGEKPLLFSFNAVSTLPPDTGSEYPGSLTAEVIWLDKDFNSIGTGLRMFVPADRINNISRITFFAQTDRPPANAANAKIVFSKGEGLSESSSDIILIDGIVLAPMACPDLLKNGDFEANLFGWTAVPGNDTAFLSSYKESLGGAGHVQTHFNGSLIQDIDVRQFPPGTSFLLSFAVQGVGPVTLNVRLEWRDAGGNPIGSGLNLSIPNETLANQGNYLSYLNVSFPTLPGTATARLIFAAVVPNPTYYLRLDQVIFAPVLTTNLITNPSFANGLNNWQHNLVNLIQRNDVYEGQADAGLGEIGGALWQDVELRHAEGHCFLFSTGLGFRRTSPTATFGTMIMKVIWLDRNDREIGLGLCLIANRQQLGTDFLEWVPYVGITEPAPAGTAKARILFSKTDSEQGFIEVDNVVFARLT
ncbi:MAG: hypothetical protein GX076_03600 [Clostridiales bacterium]|nr:hypothetical protein [Clostridiales bacterium]